MTDLLEQFPISGLLRDILGAFVILLCTFVAALVVRKGFISVLGRLTKSTTSDLDDRLLAATRKWIYWIVYVAGFAVLFNYLEARLSDTLGEQLFRAIDGANFAAGVVLIAILLVRIITTFLSWYYDTVAARTATTVDDEFIPLIDRAAKVIIYLLALLIILDHFDVDINGLVAVLGVGSLAIALAAKDTLANMIGGFVIMIDRPFRLGDRVQLPDGTKSIVHEIGIRLDKVSDI